MWGIRCHSLVGGLKGKINIEHVEDTRLLKINVTDTDPVNAKNIANALARAYIDFNIENRLKSFPQHLELDDRPAV